MQTTCLFNLIFRLYNKESVLEYLLDKSTSDAADHIRSLKVIWKWKMLLKGNCCFVHSNFVLLKFSGPIITFRKNALNFQNHIIKDDLTFRKSTKLKLCISWVTKPSSFRVTAFDGSCNSDSCC